MNVGQENSLPEEAGRPIQNMEAANFTKRNVDARATKCKPAHALKSKGEAYRFLLWRRVMAQLQKLARGRLDAGEPVDWFAIAACWAMASAHYPTGSYQIETEDEQVEPEDEDESGDLKCNMGYWAPATAKRFLTGGQRIFADISEAWPSTQKLVEAGIRAGLAGGTVYNRAGLAGLLRVTLAERKAYRLDVLPPIDATAKEVRAASNTRKPESVERRQDEKNADRRTMTKAEYLSQEAAKTAELRRRMAETGYSESTIRRQMKAEAQAQNAVDTAKLTEVRDRQVVNKEDISRSSVSLAMPKGLTIAGTALLPETVVTQDFFSPTEGQTLRPSPKPEGLADTKAQEPDGGGDGPTAPDPIGEGPDGSGIPRACKPSRDPLLDDAFWLGDGFGDPPAFALDDLPPLARGDIPDAGVCLDEFA